MLAKCRSVAVFGIEAYPVEVEVDVRGGLPDVAFVGLPDAAVKEARDRVRSALSNSGYRNPQHHTVVILAPADIKKEGPAFDLPIAVGMLAATGSYASPAPGTLYAGIIESWIQSSMVRPRSSTSIRCPIGYCPGVPVASVSLQRNSPSASTDTARNASPEKPV